METQVRQKVQSRANRIVGQIEGIQRMVEEDRYCLDILNQIAAVRSALDALGVELLNQHVEHCILGQGEGKEHAKGRPMNREALLTELRAALARFLR